VSTRATPTAAVLEVVYDYRSRLASLEAVAVARLQADHLRLQRRITQRANDLRERIQAAQRAGRVVRPSWLHEEDRLLQLMDQVADDVDRFGAAASSTVTTSAQRAAELGQRSAGESVALASGGMSAEVVAATLPADAVAALQAVSHPPAPVGQVLATMGPGVAQELREQLIYSLAVGESPHVTARRMHKVAVEQPLWRSRTIARTELLRAYRGANVAVFAGLDVVSGWVWISAANGRTCGACWAMHGTLHADGEELESHPNCRCVPAPHVPGHPPLVDPGAKTLKAMPEDELAGIIGARKAKALKAGKITPADLVGSRFSPVWGITRTEASYQGALANARLRKAGKRKALPPDPPPVVPELDVDPQAVALARLEGLREERVRATTKAEEASSALLNAELALNELRRGDATRDALTAAERRRTAALDERDRWEAEEDRLAAAIREAEAEVLRAGANAEALAPRQGAYQVARHDGPVGEWLETEQGRRFAADWTAAHPDRPDWDWARRHDDGNSDEALADLYRAQGMDGLPELVSREELDAYPGHVLYRGVQNRLTNDGRSDYGQDFRAGDYFAGLGIYGNGTYTARAGSLTTKVGERTSALDVARGYAGGPHSGDVTAMKLRTDAKVVTESELAEMQAADLTAWRAQPHVQAMDELHRGRLEELLFYDLGRYGSARGIDAYLVPERTTGVTDYMVVLNRTALLVDELPVEWGSAW
jgi:hypothetical protein